MGEGDMLKKLPHCLYLVYTLGIILQQLRTL